MTAPYRRPQPSRETLFNAIHSPDGYVAGYELDAHMSARAPWTWLRLVPSTRNEPSASNVHHCEKIRRLTAAEADVITRFQQVGFLICRVVLVESGNRFAQAAIE